MNTDNKGILVFTILLALATTLGIGCKRDKCKRVTCVHGTCIDGTCNCESGYYGEDCGSIMNEGYLYSWAAQEECRAGSDEYTVQVSPVEGSLNELNFIGMFDQLDTLVCTVTGDGYSMEFARQRVGSVEMSGTATVNSYRDQIDLSYEVFSPGSTQSFDQCTATLTR